MKLEKIYWKDIDGLSETWMSREDLIVAGKASFDETCISVGEVLFENEDFLIIASTFDGVEMWHDASMIMKSVVVKRELI